MAYFENHRRGDLFLPRPVANGLSATDMVAGSHQPQKRKRVENIAYLECRLLQRPGTLQHCDPAAQSIAGPGKLDPAFAWHGHQHGRAIPGDTRRIWGMVVPRNQ